MPSKDFFVFSNHSCPVRICKTCYSTQSTGIVSTMYPDSVGDNTTGFPDGENDRDSDREKEQSEHEGNDNGEEISSRDDLEDDFPDLLDRHDDGDDEEEDGNHADGEADPWNDDRSLDDHDSNNMENYATYADPDES